MTNTNEDRIRALVEYSPDTFARKLGSLPPGEFRADLLQLLSDKQALERERVEAVARLVEAYERIGVLNEKTEAMLVAIEQDPLRAEAAEASLTAAQERVGELEKNLADVIRAYDHAIKVTVGEGGRRSWHMKAAKLAVAHDLSRALLTPTPCSQQGPGIGGGVS